MRTPWRLTGIGLVAALLACGSGLADADPADPGPDVLDPGDGGVYPPPPDVDPGDVAPSTPPAGLAPVAVGREFFVAPGGSDANAGTQAAPFATLEKAQAAVRAVKAAGLPVNGVAVTLRGGTYWRTGQLRLTSADSGAADRPVIWRAYPGETVRLSGGKRITGWTEVTSGDASYRRIHSAGTLYKASLGLASYGAPGSAMAELFYDRQPMQLGRWPDAGLAAITGSGVSLTSTAALPAHGWSDAAAQAEANRPYAYVNTNGYRDALVRIDGVSGNRITLHRATSPLDAQAVWYAMNLLEEVDQPGEYWIDRVAGVVYFRPPDDADPDESGGEAVVSQFTGFLLWVDATASHLQLRGITFEAAQGDMVYVDAGSRNVTFDGCTFRNSAGVGMILAGADHVVDRSLFTGLGSLGLVVKPAATRATLSYNEIHRIARYLHNGIAGMAISGSGHAVRNNVIHHLPWAAIAYRATGSVIELNEFYATQQQGGDAGTLSLGGTAAATEIRHNYFHDVPRPAAPWYYSLAGVYIDAGAGGPDATGFDVHGNLFHRYGDGAPQNAYGMTAAIINKGSGNTFRGNVFARVDDPYQWSTYASTAACTGNQGWMVGTSLPAGNVVQDPGFLDEAGGNLANRSDGSLVVAGSSEVIPFSSIGFRE